MSEGEQCREHEFDVDESTRRRVIDLYKAAPLILEQREDRFVLKVDDKKDKWIEVVPGEGVYVGTGDAVDVVFTLHGNKVKATVFECEIVWGGASQILYYAIAHVLDNKDALGWGLAKRLEANVKRFLKRNGVSETLKTLISRVKNFVDDYWESVKALERLIYGIAYKHVKDVFYRQPSFSTLAYLNLIGVDVFDILNDTVNKEKPWGDPPATVSDVVDELIEMLEDDDDAIELLKEFAKMTGRRDLAHLIRKIRKIEMEMDETTDAGLTEEYGGKAAASLVSQMADDMLAGKKAKDDAKMLPAAT